MFTDPDKPKENFPKLKGRGCEVKDVVRPIAHIWETFKNPEDGFHNRISEVLAHLCDMHVILTEYAKDTFLPIDAATEFRTLVELFLKKYSLLAKQADDYTDLLFAMTPKFHYLWHLAQRAQYLNPRKSNCALDEDYVGKCKVVVSSSVHGTPAHRVPEKVNEK